MPGVHEAALSILDRMLDIATDPDELLPRSKAMTVAEAQALSYILARWRRYEEAIEILFDVIQRQPESGSLQWLLDWLDDPRCRGKVPPASSARFFRWVFATAEELAESNETSASIVERLPGLVDRLRATDNVDGDVLSASAIALRRTGYFDAALSTAIAAYDLYPSWLSAIAVANCRRSTGDLDEAVRMFEQALVYDPEDIATRLELGDIHYVRGDFEQAERWYDEALKREPQHPWALPSSYAVKYWMSGAPEWTAKLAQLAATNPRAQQLANFNVPYISMWLPDPVDATINMARDIFENDAMKRGDSINVNIGLLEAPSPRTVIQRILDERGVTLNLKTNRLQEPDPRKPFGDVEYVLWTYDDTTPIPAVKPPSAGIAKVVAEIAAMDYDYRTWCRLAAQAATSVKATTDLLGVMIFPAGTSKSIPSWDWLLRNQIAAALMMAALPGTWKGSTKRSMLLSLVDGPLDWTVGAGAIGLAYAAETDADAADDALTHLSELVNRLPDDGHVCYLFAAVASLLQLSNLPASSRKQYVDILAQERSVHGGAL